MSSNPSYELTSFALQILSVRNEITQEVKDEANKILLKFLKTENTDGK